MLIFPCLIRVKNCFQKCRASRSPADFKHEKFGIKSSISNHREGQVSLAGYADCLPKKGMAQIISCDVHSLLKIYLHFAVLTQITM